MRREPADRALDWKSAELAAELDRQRDWSMEIARDSGRKRMEQEILQAAEEFEAKRKVEAKRSRPIKLASFKC